MGRPVNPFTPDLALYLQWSRVLRDHGGGLMTAADAARVLRVPPQTLLTWLHRGGPLDAVQIRRQPRGPQWVRVVDVLELAEEGMMAGRVSVDGLGS